MNVDDQNELSIVRMCSALANKHRLKIFARIAKCCTPGTNWDAKKQIPCCVGEISKDLGIASSTASHHVKELASAELITLEREGQRVICKVSEQALSNLVSFLEELQQ